MSGSGSGDAAWRDAAVVVAGRDLPAALAVVPEGALTLGDDLVPTAGTWSVDDGCASFTPRFAPVPGTTFVVVGRQDPRVGPWTELARATVPTLVAAPTTSVVTIDPVVEEVPANLLRFGLTFSAPMAEGSASDHVHLLDEHGAELLGALFEMPQELWSRDHDRLTVLLEPGRIKRGLQPHELAGSPLREGSSVTLVVDAACLDAGGSPLRQDARRTYRVGAPLRARIDPARWEVHWPEAATDPLVVRFDRVLDRILITRCLRVVDEVGERVSGGGAIDHEARTWSFSPAEGRFAAELRVDTRLEDLAGNSVRRVFDRDLSDPADDSLDVGVAEVVLCRPAASARPA